MKSTLFNKPAYVILLSLCLILLPCEFGLAAEPIKLGFVGPLSGELSSYGIPALRGVENSTFVKVQ